MRRRGDGAAWLRAHGLKVSTLGERAADLIDAVWDGIYHERGVLRGTWDDDMFVQFCVYGEFSTYDHDYLTRLVIEAHDRALRVSLEGAAPHYIRVTIHGRTREHDSPYFRHPSIGDALYAYRR